MPLDETLALIETLYSPHQSADVVLKTQQQLQSIQKQDNANLLAHELLKSNSQNVQFFGALTYTVYFTTHYNSIVNLNNFTLLLLNELIDAFNRNLSSLIINKLISNLSKVYIKSLLNPLNLLFEKLLLNNENNENNENNQKVTNLALLSCKIFAEELNTSSDLLSKDQHEIVLNDLFDLTTKNILNSTLNPFTKNLWLDCLQAWMNYLIKIEFDYSFKNIDLNNYFNIIIDLISNNNDINSINLLIDLYDLNPSLLNSSNKLKLDNLIFSDWTLNFINTNLNDIDNLSILSKFITLFLDSDMINLASKLVDPNFDFKFQFLLNLTNQKNIPIINDPFSVDLLDFWILFTESFINDIETIHLILKNDKFKINLLNEKSHNYFLNLSEIYWKKCHLIEDDNDLNDYFDEFRNFRRDISELFESLFSISRNEIFNNLVDSIIINLNNDSILSNDQINDIETSLYLLTSICSILTENGISSDFLNILNSLFNSKFLEKIIIMENNPKYNYLIKNSIKFLSEINWFYENPIGINYINDVLIFLFQNLDKKIFQDLSSKAILMITDSCRDKLSNLINDFEIAANSMIINKFDVEIIVRSRIIRSYANILQTIKNLDLKSEKISNFLDLIYNESINAYKLINSNDTSNTENLENINNFIFSMISSLVGLSKGLQIPDDWEDYFENNENEIHEIYNYWKFNDKYQVHNKCLKLISLYSFPNEIIGFGTNLNSKILDQIFEFFKAGLSEPFPGPFVIDENLIIEFIIKCSQYCQENYNSLGGKKSIEHPMIKIIQLYGLVINSNHVSITISKITNLQLGADNLRMDEVIDEILFKQFNHIISDIDLIQEIFTLFANIISKYPSDLLKNKNIIKILQVSIEQLYINNQQRFIIISLSKLWTNLIYLRKGKLEDVEFIKNLLINENFGNLLVFALMKGFINTSRSNIEFYSDIIRSLTVKYGKYLNNWIIESFDKINSEKRVIEDDEVNKFIKKLILTRGNRAANRVIQDFWYKLTGLVDYGM